VVAATFDEAVDNQTRVAELALERAKRMVESRKDVLMLVDGITRLTAPTTWPCLPAAAPFLAVSTLWPAPGQAFLRRGAQYR